MGYSKLAVGKFCTEPLRREPRLIFAMFAARLLRAVLAPHRKRSAKTGEPRFALSYLCATPPSKRTRTAVTPQFFTIH